MAPVVDFNRNFSVEVNRQGDDHIAVVVRMVDVVHDITLNLMVSRANFTIVNAEIDLTRVPDENCNLIVPIIKKLIGLSIVRGFSKNASGILGGGRGCPNVLSMVTIGAPLAVNVAYSGNINAQAASRDGKLLTEVKQSEESYLKGVCVAHPSDLN